MAKTFAANVTQEAIDDALQFCGGNGIAYDLPIARFHENVRQFRLVDGADEVHRRSIARDAFETRRPRSLRPSRGSASSTKSRVDSSGHSSLPSSWNTSNSSGSVPNLRTFVTTELRRLLTSTPYSL